ncbi:glycosyltransferase [Streptomyces sp. NPDC001978]|uniref:glycosyltransferase n=1 Tax=Streptomyces sp. NPDC001978 TaxID=3364627 RepID=UPI003678404E
MVAELAMIDHDFEIIYVDDGGRDRTLSILEQLSDRDSHVRFVSFSRNFGKGAAMLAGLRHASGDAVVIRMLSRRATDAVLELAEYNRFSKGLFARVGFPTATFEYQNSICEQGRSKWTFGKLLNYGLDGLLSFNNKPLRIAVYLGMLPLSVALAYAAWIVGSALVNGVKTPGCVTLIAVITALSGVQMVMLGVVSEYVDRIYCGIKRRPHFLVKATNIASAGPGRAGVDPVGGQAV